jgi:hypothetical protein
LDPRCGRQTLPKLALHVGRLSFELIRHSMN